MTSFTRFVTLITTLLLAVVLLVACGAPQAETGPAEMFPLAEGEPTAAAPQAPAAAAATSIAASPADSPTEPAAAPVVAEGIELDAGGIQVGFTPEGRPFRGSPDAPVIMEVFSDYQCPYCGRFAANTMPSLLSNQVSGGEVQLVFYDFPLTNIHPQATAAANAARCAGEQSATAYWLMHDRLFESMGDWANGRANDVFREYGAELGLDAAQFSACLDESRYEDAIMADLDLGRSRGVSSTPSFFLNDQPVIGAQPLDVFNQAIAAVGSGETIAAAEEPAAPAVKPTPATIVFDDIAGEMGDPNAAVTIVEYTDYQCPYCQRHSSDTLPQLISQLVESGRVHYVLKDFPLDNLHPQARDAAAAARCAGEQDAYWPMHDAIFAGQAEWSGNAAASDVFVRMATDLSLDGDALQSCLESGRYADAIQANLDEGLSLGVTGTPSFFIAGFPISGAQPYELFEYAVGLAEEGTLADAYVPREEPQQPQAPTGPVEVNTDGAYSIGAADAPVVLVEFTDFQCPFCSRHYLQTYPQIKAEYVDTGKVRYVFMDFPLTNIHPQAVEAAEAARCAGAQGDYVGMHDRLFAGQDEWSGNPAATDVFVGYAEELGLDSAALRTCLESGEQEAIVMADMDQGISLGVSGTPAFFINGNFVSGAQPFEVFQQQIEAQLGQ